MNLFWLFDGWLRSMYSVLAYPALVFPLASLARRLNWDHTVKLGTLPFTVNLNQGYAGDLSRFSHKSPVQTKSERHKDFLEFIKLTDYGSFSLLDNSAIELALKLSRRRINLVKTHASHVSN
ncbi:hypothetical protein CIHG_07132 [Coccidioides immitis H538.4]|uniref:Uncharacterized protein n=2 Tax=Coccidioides immitis TaxID=5501 RepID=A0A0J8UNY0_COCIT|nr:hypothetical protein CIRG_08645 [Coccidioides immitis RMSCC 2394]KMU89198.1 hypothetical protein CIHG_07132 [Coccidioides immitis H538.4]